VIQQQRLFVRTSLGVVGVLLVLGSCGLLRPAYEEQRQENEQLAKNLYVKASEQAEERGEPWDVKAEAHRYRDIMAAIETPTVKLTALRNAALSTVYRPLFWALFSAGSICLWLRRFLELGKSKAEA
jgi:hypothetical protein